MRGLLGSPALTAARRASFGLPLRRDGRSFPVVAGLHVEAAFSGSVCRVAVSFVLIACDNYRVHGLDVQWNFGVTVKKSNELRAVVFVSRPRVRPRHGVSSVSTLRRVLEHAFRIDRDSGPVCSFRVYAIDSTSIWIT